MATTFSVDGLHCQGCAETVKRTISASPGVNSVQVALQTKGVSTVTVDAGHELNADEIQAALNTQGNFTVV